MTDSTLEKVIAILAVMAEDGEVADTVLNYLDQGMFDEWDSTLLSGITEYGFGGPELCIAARSGLSIAKYHLNRTKKES